MIDKIQNNVSAMVEPSNPDGVEKANDEAKKKFAKGFEQLMLNKLLESAQSTMPNPMFGNDSGSKQIQGMFWMFLSQGVAENGGVGLADQIYENLSQMDNSVKSLDHKA